MVIIKIDTGLYFEFINYRFVSKIRYIYIIGKKNKENSSCHYCPLYMAY